MVNLASWINQLVTFLTVDIWKIQLSGIGRLKSSAIRLIRIIVLSVRGFYEDNLPLRASALTFYSLLSLVPVLAMAFGIAKGFGFQKMLEKRLLENFRGQEELLTQMIGYAHSLLESTKGGLVAGIGVAVLFWSVVKVLTHIENSFNDIWGIKSARTFGRKFSDYLSIMLIGPLLLIMSGSVTVFITTQITSIMNKISLLGIVSPLIYFLLKLLPYGLLWVLFSIVYVLMPNTKVKIGSGLIAGIVAGTFYHGAQWVYINFQLGAARYNAIYGSFAALPLFLIWLQLSWLIVLLGAEISFAHQNAETFEYEPTALNISFSHKRLMALIISHLMVKNFMGSNNPLTAIEMSNKLEIPIRLVRQILDELVDSKTFSITQSNGDKEPAYQPARDINYYSIQYINEALDHRGNNDINIKDSKELRSFTKAFESFHDTINNSPQNKLLKDI